MSSPHDPQPQDPRDTLQTLYLVAGIIAAAAACVFCCIMARRAAGPSPWHGWEKIFDEGTLAENLWAMAGGVPFLIFLFLVAVTYFRWKKEL